MLGLTREKVPGFVTTLYVSLVLYCLLGAYRADGFDILTWAAALLLLTFPLSLTFKPLMSVLPGLGESGFVALILVFAAANALVIRRVCRRIVGAG